MNHKNISNKQSIDVFGENISKDLIANIQIISFYKLPMVVYLKYIRLMLSRLSIKNSISFLPKKKKKKKTLQ